MSGPVTEIRGVTLGETDTDGNNYNDSDSCDSLLDIVNDLDSDGFDYNSPDEQTLQVIHGATESESDDRVCGVTNWSNTNENNDDLTKTGVEDYQKNAGDLDVAKYVDVNDEETPVSNDNNFSSKRDTEKDSVDSNGSDHILTQFLDSSSEHVGSSLNIHLIPIFLCPYNQNLNQKSGY